MPARDPGPYFGLSTKQLEDLLRRPDTPADRQQLIRDELGRRYEAELLENEGGAAYNLPPPPPTSPPPLTTSGQRGSEQDLDAESGLVPSLARSAPKPQPPAKAKSGVSALKAVLLVLAGLLVGVIFAAYQILQESTPPSGTRCVIAGGSSYCPLAVDLPRGASCVCSDGTSQYPGYVG